MGKQYSLYTYNIKSVIMYVKECKKGIKASLKTKVKATN